MWKKTILIVDDEVQFSEVLQMRLEANRYTVHTAASGEEGIQKAASLQPGLILLDVMMPGIDGYETLRRLRQDTKTRQIPVVMLTAKGESKSIFRAQELGASDYIIKPCPSEELLQMVRRYLP
jgi:CheY-like chemotaxis protein